jgi:hypothetical protein
MSIGSTIYPQPVHVNGFICRNCTDVDNAKKHIDPAHPKSGPYGVNAATDPTNPKSFVQFGGNLAGIPSTAARTALQSSGQLVDIQV